MQTTTRQKARGRNVPTSGVLLTAPVAAIIWLGVLQGGPAPLGAEILPPHKPAPETFRAALPFAPAANLHTPAVGVPVVESAPRTVAMVSAAGIPVPDHKPAGDAPVAGQTDASTGGSGAENAGEYAVVNSGVVPVPLPRPLTDGHDGLSPSDAAAYARIFRLQQEGKWEEADRESEGLTDLFLRGHVLYQRFMHPAQYQSSFEELRGWLALYADHPGADAIYKLALSRMPSGERVELNKPALNRAVYGVHRDLREVQSFIPRSYIDETRNAASRKLVGNIIDQVRKHLKNGGPTAGLTLMDRADNRKILSDLEYASLKAEVAMTYMHLGYWDKAFALARESIEMSRGMSPLAGWVAGLISWRNGDYGSAAAYFERAAQDNRASPWTVSAGAYWAARAHMRSGNFAEVSRWLAAAAKNQRTFYGLIATRALGAPFSFNWEVPHFTPEMQRQLMQYPGALRALALVQVGQVHLAEEELKYIHPGEQSRLQDALLAYAYDTGLPAYQMRLASLLTRPQGGFYDAALYPIAPWKKTRAKGKVDEAVLNAFIRQESRFRSGAENESGATGLMQIMPATANYVMNTKRFEGSGRERLKDPELNMQIGETYIYNLLNQDAVDNDLFSLAIAYNAGPGNLRRWKAERADIDDPLLFIETIPVGETRAFVERVMTNIWIYRLRLGQSSASLDAVAEGRWPRYNPMDGGTLYARSEPLTGY